MQNNPSTDHSGRVVVAEDDAAMRDVLVCVLTAEGYDVEPYGRGDELLEGLLTSAARGCKPALVIADVCLPGLTGLAVLRELRERRYGAPVIVISAFCSEELLNDAIALGASVVLSKPFAIDDLRRVVRCFLPRARPTSP